MHRESEDGDEIQDEEIKVDREGAQMYVRTDNEQFEDEGTAPTLGNDEEQRFMDLEDRKILNKRKKRVSKIEDCYFNLDQFF